MGGGSTQSPANVHHMTREELEDRCDALDLMHLSTDSDRDLAEWIAEEEHAVRRRDNPEEIRDERSDEDVYEGVE